MSWAKPAVSIKIGPSPTTKLDHMMTAAINTDIVSFHKDSISEQCVDSTPKCRNKKRTLKESMFDKENIPTVENADKDASKPPAKRILLQRDVTGGIKNSKGKASGKVKPTRKQIKLLKGQRQLTNFFR